MYTLSKANSELCPRNVTQPRPIPSSTPACWALCRVRRPPSVVHARGQFPLFPRATKDERPSLSLSLSLLTEMENEFMTPFGRPSVPPSVVRSLQKGKTKQLQRYCSRHRRRGRSRSNGDRRGRKGEGREGGGEGGLYEFLHKTAQVN